MKELKMEDLKIEAKAFCDFMKKENHKTLIGVTDGKAVGTYVEHRFVIMLSNKVDGILNYEW